MSDKQKYLITCRFPSWGYEKNDEYPAFGVRYLITISLDELTKGGEKDEQGFYKDLNFSEDANIRRKFKELYGNMANNSFDGEILFIEQSDIIIL